MNRERMTSRSNGGGGASSGTGASGSRYTLRQWRYNGCRATTSVEHAAAQGETTDGIVLEQTGPTSVYASFLEKGCRQPIYASGASDGHVQLLLLTALVSEGQQDSVLLFDEPEVSLHPWALVVFARAVTEAAQQWNNQVLLATHSPVLISQFDPQDILVASMVEGHAWLERLSEIHDFRDLL